MYYSNARKTAKISLFFLHIVYVGSKQKKKRKNIEKEIQNQPPYSGGV